MCRLSNKTGAILRVSCEDKPACAERRGGGALRSGSSQSTLPSPFNGYLASDKSFHLPRLDCITCKGIPNKRRAGSPQESSKGGGRHPECQPPQVLGSVFLPLSSLCARLCPAPSTTTLQHSRNPSKGSFLQPLIFKDLLWGTGI